jgi:hypothetical protein
MQHKFLIYIAVQYPLPCGKHTLYTTILDKMVSTALILHNTNYFTIQFCKFLLKVPTNNHLRILRFHTIDLSNGSVLYKEIFLRSGAHWTLVVVGNILPWSLPIVHIATGLAKVSNSVCNWGALSLLQGSICRHVSSGCLVSCNSTPDGPLVNLPTPLRGLHFSICPHR